MYKTYLFTKGNVFNSQRAKIVGSWYLFLDRFIKLSKVLCRRSQHYVVFIKTGTFYNFLIVRTNLLGP